MSETSSPAVRSVLVLGAGSAGLIAALSLKRKLPQLTVRIVRSPDIGVIGVGEGTTPNFPLHLFDYLGLNRKKFHELAEPTWKLGIRFLWGARKRFDYTFDQQLDFTAPELRMPNGYYCDEDFSRVSLPSALMYHGKAFAKQDNGCPDIEGWHAFHIENEKLVRVLEMAAREFGVEITDGKVTGAEQLPQGGIAAVMLEDGQRLEADFFIDASGFRSELLGKTLGEEYISFGNALFCDRAVVGGWDRGEEPILPYTTAEEMDAGWSWQIEHEHHVNRGYVYSSQFISDDEAAEEFKRKNPKVPESPRVVRFRSGCYRRQWVENVVAIGNAGGFVEPLEATALMIVCSNMQTLVEMLNRSRLMPSPSLRDLFNELTGKAWTDIRDFLALHYKLNSAPQTPFWKHCRAETDPGAAADLLDFYRENGPNGFCRYRLSGMQNDFGLEGYLVMLVGNKVPHRAPYAPPEADRKLWEARREMFSQQAMDGLDVKETLAFIRHPGWQWHGDGNVSQAHRM